MIRQSIVDAKIWTKKCAIAVISWRWNELKANSSTTPRGASATNANSTTHQATTPARAGSATPAGLAIAHRSTAHGSVPTLTTRPGRSVAPSLSAASPDTTR